MSNSFADTWIQACCLLPCYRESEHGREERGRNRERICMAAGMVCVSSSLEKCDDEEEPLLQSRYTHCLDHPDQELTVEKNAQPTFLYTREGPVKMRQVTKKCKACKTKYYHGFKYVDRTRVYDVDVLSKSHIVTGSHTAFSTKQLHEWCLLILRGNIWP